MAIAPPLVEALTMSASKRQLYPLDSYYRRSAADAAAAAGPRADELLRSLALLIVKPEAFVAGRADVGLSIVERNGFRPLLSRVCHLSRHMVSELWRYQWNAATLQKMDAAELINACRPSVLIMLGDAHWTGTVPAAVRLKGLKGDSRPDARAATSLRGAVGAPSRLLTMFHASDEPADVLRELGILLDAVERRSLFRQLAELRDRTEDTAESVRATLSLLQASPGSEHDLDARASMRRLHTAAAPSPDRADAIAAAVDDLAHGRPFDCRAFVRMATQAGASEWDALAVLAHHLQHDDGSCAPLVSTTDEDVARWNDWAVDAPPRGVDSRSQAAR
jgi:hypothetical protein